MLKRVISHLTHLQIRKIKTTDVEPRLLSVWNLFLGFMFTTQSVTALRSFPLGTRNDVFQNHTQIFIQFSGGNSNQGHPKYETLRLARSLSFTFSRKRKYLAQPG